MYFFFKFFILILSIGCFVFSSTIVETEGCDGWRFFGLGMFYSRIFRLGIFFIFKNFGNSRYSSALHPVFIPQNVEEKIFLFYLTNEFLGVIEAESDSDVHFD